MTFEKDTFGCHKQSRVALANAMRCLHAVYPRVLLQRIRTPRSDQQREIPLQMICLIITDDSVAEHLPRAPLTRFTTCRPSLDSRAASEAQAPNIPTLSMTHRQLQDIWIVARIAQYDRLTYDQVMVLCSIQ
jgi:hypothetical protein